MTSTIAAIPVVCSPRSPQAMGLTVVFDDSFPSRHVHFDIEDAISPSPCGRLRGHQDFSVALEDTVIFSAPTTPRTIASSIAWACARFTSRVPIPPRILTEIATSLRTVFEFKFVSIDQSVQHNHRAWAAAALEAATQFLAQLNSPLPEVMFDSESLPGEPQLRA